MKVLPLVWTIVYGASGVGVSQTTTPLESMDSCVAAESNIEKVKVSTEGWSVSPLSPWSACHSEA